MTDTQGVKILAAVPHQLVARGIAGVGEITTEAGDQRHGVAQRDGHFGPIGFGPCGHDFDLEVGVQDRHRQFGHFPAQQGHHHDPPADDQLDGDRTLEPIQRVIAHFVVRRDKAHDKKGLGLSQTAATANDQYQSRADRPILSAGCLALTVAIAAMNLIGSYD